MAREWTYETDRWLLGYCWLPLDVEALVLAAFGGGKLLAVAIPTIVPLIFLLSLYCPCLCNYDITSEYAHNRHTRGGWREEHVK